MTYSSTVLADSPSSYWRLGETSGTFAADEVSGNPGGTYTGGVLLDQSPIFSNLGRSAFFDGVDDYVLVSSGAYLDRVAPLSVELAFKPSSLPGAGVYTSLASKQSAYGFRLFGDQLEFYVFVSGSSSPTVRAVSGEFVVGTSYHIVGTYNGTNLRLYKNGVELPTVSPQARTGTVTTNTNAYRIGSNTGTNQFFHGYQSDVAVYPSALTGARVAAHHDAAAASTNVAPTASAGTNQIDLEPFATVQLAGTASDSDGTVASTVWSKVSGPTPIGALSSTTILNPTFEAVGRLTAATDVWRLTVTDNLGAVTTSDVSTTYLPANEFMYAADGSGLKAVQFVTST